MTTNRATRRPRNETSRQEPRHSNGGPIFRNPATAGSSQVAELLGVAFIVAYTVVLFRPFVLIRELPGSAAWVGLPALGLAAVALTPTSRIGKIPISASLLALITWTAVSISWTVNSEATSVVLRSEIPAVVILFFVVGSMRQTLVVAALLGSFVAIGIWSLLTSLVLPMSQFTLLTNGTFAEVQVGWRGTFLHKNLLGVFAILGLSITLTLVERRGLRIAGAMLFVALIIGTRSATAASGLIVIAVVLSWMTWLQGLEEARSRAIAKIGSAALVAVALASTVALLPSLVAVYGKDLTFTGRTEIWAASLQNIAERPLLGHGTGAVWYDPVHPLTADLHRRIGFAAAHAHQGALDVLLALGAIGLTLTLLFVGSTVRLAVRTLRTSHWQFGAWVLASIAGVATMSLSEPLLQGPVLGMLALMWSVLAVVGREPEQAEFVVQSSP